MKLKTRELKSIRRLAQEVLLQRSDVETFLLSSLHQVRGMCVWTRRELSVDESRDVPERWAAEA